MFAALLLIQLAGIAWAVRRIRRWRRGSAARPVGSRGVLIHLALPVTVDFAVAAGAWWLTLVSADAPVVVVMRYQPDLFVALVVVTLLSLGWGGLRTWLTVRAMRGDPAPPEAISATG